MPLQQLRRRPNHRDGRRTNEPADDSHPWGVQLASQVERREGAVTDAGSTHCTATGTQALNEHLFDVSEGGLQPLTHDAGATC